MPINHLFYKTFLFQNSSYFFLFLLRNKKKKVNKKEKSRNSSLQPYGCGSN